MANKPAAPKTRRADRVTDPALPVPESQLPPADGIPAGEGEEELLNFDPGETDEERRLAQILQEEGASESKFEVSRKDSMGRWNFCVSIPVMEWSADTKQAIAAQYGAGEYRARMRRGSGDRRNTFGGGFIFRVEAANVSDRPAPSPSVGGLPVPAQPSRDAGRGEDRYTELILQMQNQQAEARREMMQIMQANQATLVTVLTTALTQKPVQPSEKLIEIVAERALKPDNQLATLIGALVQLKRVADESLSSRDNSEPKRDVWSALIEALPNVLQLLTRAAPAPVPSPADTARRVTPIAVAPPAASPVAVSPAEAPIVVATPTGEPAAAKPVEDPGLVSVKAALLPILPALCQAADTQQDPVAIADQLAEQLTDEQLTALQVFLRRSDWLAVLIDTHEPVTMRSVWFTSLRTAVLDIVIEPEPAGAPANQPPAGSPAQ